MPPLASKPCEGHSVLGRYPLAVKLIFHNSASVPIQSGTQFYAASQFGRGDAVIVPVVIRGGETVKSSVLKRSIVVAGHKTSVSLFAFLCLASIAISLPVAKTERERRCPMQWRARPAA